MSAKLLRLTEDMVRRVRRAGYVFDMERCVICGVSFKGAVCPHDNAQNFRAVQMVKDRDGVI